MILNASKDKSFEKSFEKSFDVIPAKSSKNTFEVVLSIVESTSSAKDNFIDKDILCYGRILNTLSDNIYHIFCHTKTVIEL